MSRSYTSSHPMRLHCEKRDHFAFTCCILERKIIFWRPFVLLFGDTATWHKSGWPHSDRSWPTLPACTGGTTEKCLSTAVNFFGVRALLFFYVYFLTRKLQESRSDLAKLLPWQFTLQQREKQEHRHLSSCSSVTPYFSFSSLPFSRLLLVILTLIFCFLHI
jgi:hypothetical protein